MIYAPSQLPFLEYKDMVKRIKRDFDKRGGHYPLEIIVTDLNGQQLMEHKFNNVWEHNLQPQIVAELPIEGPLCLQVWEHDKNNEPWLELVELEVKFKRPSEQMNFEQFFASLEEAA
jgi:hypothetical protein